MKKVFIAWLPLAFIATFFAFLSYGLAQQTARQGANDPQIQMAEDGARAIENGASPTAAVGDAPVIDFSKSLAPFVIVFDNNGKPIASSGNLNGAVPPLPSGVFDYTRLTAEDTFTWQPQDGVRIAATIARVAGPKYTGFVLSGRSLREVEYRAKRLFFMSAIAWFLAILGLFVLEIFIYLFT